MSLDLSSLEKAIDALSSSLKIAHQATNTPTVGLFEVIRAGVIQNFEVAYEQSWKMIKRFLEKNFASDYVDGITRRELYRLAAESQLIQDVDLWMNFHRARNETSHTYNKSTAADVFNSAESFLAEVQMLLAILKKKND